MQKIKIVIIEDRVDVVRSIINALEGAEDITVAAQYRSAEEAVRSLHTDGADIYLVDLGLPGVDGVAFITAALEVIPDTDFIVHTISENSRDLLDALSSGAVGYIVKGCPDSELLDGIRIVAEGGGLISPRMARRLAHHFKEIGTQRKPLTKAETEVLNKLKLGSSYEEIAEQSNVSLSTIQTHIKNIYKKLNVKNRKDAVSTGILFGLITK